MPGKRTHEGVAKAITEETALNPVQRAKLEMLYLETIIAPETTSSLPLLYSTGPNTQKLVPEATFAKLPQDFPQSGILTYPPNHRMGLLSVGAGGDYSITDQLGQPLQNLNILGDQATQAGQFELKNQAGYDGTYRLTAPGGTPNFVVEAPAQVIGGVQTPSDYTELEPINATFDPTVWTDISKSPFYAGSTCFTNIVPYPFHGATLPIGRANGKKYFHIDACNQVFTNGNNGGQQLPPTAAYTAAATIGTATVNMVAAGTTSSCIVIKEGSTDPALQQVFPGLAPLVAGDKVFVVLHAFKNNTDGNPLSEKAFVIPSGWVAGSAICIFPTPSSDEWRIKMAVLSSGAAETTPFRSFQIGFTSCGGYISHRMAPGMDGVSVQAVATASRLWATGLNLKNWTVVNGRGAIAVVYKMPKGDYYSESFGIDDGDPYTKMASQEDEIDETFEKGERLFNSPPCEEEQNQLRENIDQPTKKKTSSIPQAFLATPPYALYYDLIDRNLTGQCLKSPGIQNNITNLSGGTNVIVNQQQAQNTDSTWWCRWEWVPNATPDSQVFYKHLPPEARGAFEAAAGRAAKMKKAGPSSADLSFFLKSEGYLQRRAKAQGVGFLTY